MIDNLRVEKLIRKSSLKKIMLINKSSLFKLLRSNLYKLDTRRIDYKEIYN